MGNRRAVAILASALFGFAGLWMLTINSQASNLGTGTVFDSFFHACGVYSLAMAALVWVLFMPSTKEEQAEKESRERALKAIQEWDQQHPEG